MVFLDTVLTSLGATETILPYAKAYARIYVTGSIINVFTVMMNNLLTAQGATKFTMIAMLTGSIANVILDPIMIYGMDLGIEGSSHCYSHFFMYQYGNLYWIHSKKERCFKVFG